MQLGIETPTEEKWILKGRLTIPWLVDLRTSWKQNHRTDPVAVSRAASRVIMRKSRLAWLTRTFIPLARALYVDAANFCAGWAGG
jgi:hypothetical protein